MLDEGELGRKFILEFMELGNKKID